MGYIGSGPTRFNTADELTVTGDAEIGGIATVDALKLSETDVLLSAGETAIITSSNDVQIIRDGSIKLTATATGVDVTGGLNTTGNAGIGTSSPGGYGKLVSLGGDNATLFAAVGSTNMLRVQGYNSTYLGTVLEAVNLAQSANTPMFVNASEVKFGISGTERMRIDTSGKVGIGTSSPSELLEVNSTGASTAIEISAGLASTTTGEAKLVLRSLHSSSGTGYSRSEIASLGVAGGDSDLIFRTTTDGSGPVERMRIDSEGLVGIGTSSPSGGVQLDVRGTGVLQLVNTDTVQLLASSGGSTLKNVSNNPLLFGTNNTERMRITSGGKVLLNTTSTSYGGQIVARQSDGVSLAAVAAINTATSGTRRLIDFFTGTSTTRKGSIESDGTNTSYNTSSDYRLKENVTADWDATTRLKQLNPVRFNFIENADKTVDGFLAHEVQDIVPEAITGTKDAMMDEEYEVSAATGDIYTPAIEAVLDEDGNEVTPAVAEVIHSTDVERPEELAEGQQWRETTEAVMGTRSVPDYQGIDQSKLVPILTKALIEAVEKIEQLETRILALEAN